MVRGQDAPATNSNTTNVKVKRERAQSGEAVYIFIQIQPMLRLNYIGGDKIFARGYIQIQPMLRLNTSYPRTLRKRATHSNTTNVKVKLAKICTGIYKKRIQIQPMLRLNRSPLCWWRRAVEIQIQPMLRLNRRK